MADSSFFLFCFLCGNYCGWVCFYVWAGVAEGTIDMREFLLGMNNFSGDERVDKCRFAFMLYDEDKNGFLTMEELVQVLKATHMATKAQQVMKKAQTIMKQCDRDGDGHIDPEEFVRCWVGMLWGNRLCLWWFFFG